MGCFPKECPAAQRKKTLNNRSYCAVEKRKSKKMKLSQADCELPKQWKTREGLSGCFDDSCDLQVTEGSKAKPRLYCKAKTSKNKKVKEVKEASLDMTLKPKTTIYDRLKLMPNGLPSKSSSEGQKEQFKRNRTLRMAIRDKKAKEVMEASPDMTQKEVMEAMPEMTIEQRKQARKNKFHSLKKSLNITMPVVKVKEKLKKKTRKEKYDDELQDEYDTNRKAARVDRLLLEHGEGDLDERMATAL